ncbi:tRNA (guanosine(37)-N1)-methyltransferase TrmD [Miniphocaeibacter halophilus]|uniref:tRNA (Guanosine(37)-N1)-methyltransferase TrmD n=1 Tax=Miniphocaeibacter halophilus TaxID=2931922 RepID=A0AC61MP89_9FIRM|nr:tRNA (guanosine(37)-N1)-methyltransferase TrmD [Miniphocaeibacter halophilus]QQK07311.1 tRNA (guanosine(37)-N1)-methyltransferase TrmD [Miniphocaeibacter halophilus]
MKFKVLTLFPEFINSLNSYGVIGRAIEQEKIELIVKNIRDYSKDKHNRVDDEIYGGGAGMLMTPQPVYDSIMDVKTENSIVIYMSPQGRVLNQNICKELLNYEDIILLCGHYEGIDSRIVDNYVDMELSIGDFVMTGGELAAMVVIDSVSRLVDGVLGNEESVVTDSHYNLLLQNNVYTRPREFNGLKVPEVLFSGNHKEIEKWKHESSLKNTKEKRPDIYEKYIKDNKLK